MAPGPKVSPERLESQIIDLETRLVAYKERLLSLPGFVLHGNRSKFTFSSHQQLVNAAWGSWLLGAELVPLPPPVQAPGPETRPAAPKRRVGRPTLLEQALERDRKYHEAVERRKEELCRLWEITEDTALAIMRDEAQISHVSRVMRAS